MVLVDADPQQSSANWVRDRDETSLAKVHCIQRYGDIKSTLKDLNQRYAYVVVDVAGHDSKELRTAMLVADKLIVPFKPSQLDLDTLPHLTEVIDQALSFNEQLQCFGLLTLAPPWAKLVPPATQVVVGKPKSVAMYSGAVCPGLVVKREP